MGLKNYFFDFQRTPAPSSGLPMNSIPAVSKAFCIESSVLACAASLRENLSHQKDMPLDLPNVHKNIRATLY